MAQPSTGNLPKSAHYAKRRAGKPFVGVCSPSRGLPNISPDLQDTLLESVNLAESALLISTTIHTAA